MLNFIDLGLKQCRSKKTQNRKIILHVSNFRPVKRVLDVIRVFDIVQQNIDSELVLIGDGPDFEKARNYVDSRKLKSKVSFIGKSNNVDSILQKTDLFLLPSETESFGLVALEAMCFGIPVITTCSGGLTELVKDGKNGYACNVGDVSLMSKKAIALLCDDKLYQKMSLMAYKSAKKYDIKKIIPLYEDCYRQVLS